MTQGLQVFNPAGSLVWDSSTVAGGAVADVRSFLPTDTATLTYPAFAGRSVYIINLRIRTEAGVSGVAADTALGYPRVTVSTAGSGRRFAVVVI
jgi:hypothetical protein